MTCRPRVRWGLCAALCVALVTTAQAEPPKVADLVSQALKPMEISKRLKRYVPVDLGPSAQVPATLEPMVGPLLEAADSMDRIFWLQYSPKGRAMLDALLPSDQPKIRALAQYLAIHYGPWDWHRDDAPFIGLYPRPPGVGLYPTDLSQRELDQFISKNPGSFAQLYDPYTVIQRNRDRLVGVPYTSAYKAELATAAKALQKAAAAYTCNGGSCPCAKFVQFLNEKAVGLVRGDYVKSDLAWMDTGACPLDIAIGPYEYYVDRLLGLKTAYEAILYIADVEEGRRYQRLSEQRDALVRALPISEALRPRFANVKPSPITIADVLYTAGEARAGYQKRTFILPNDEAVRKAKGTKNVILRNVVRAKFDHLIKPLAARIFDKETASHVSFEAYFDFLLAWNMAHSIVPEKVEHADGTVSTPQQALRARHVFIDAVKGEAVALMNYISLLDSKAISRGSATELATTYLANLFDTVRLAEQSPQSIAKVIVYNYLSNEWVFRYVPRKKSFEVNSGALRQAVRKLAAETLEILARGDYAGAGRMIVQFAIVPPEMREKLSDLRDLPVDIVPRYTIRK